MTDTFYIDGHFVPSSQASVPVTDLSVLRGYGVFDFLRTYGRRPFELAAHLDRLENSAELIGMALPWGREELVSIIHETLRRNPHHSESAIRIVVTGGLSSDFITPEQPPRLLVLVTQARPLPAQWYVDGVKVCTASMERVLPTVKSINYIPAIIALQQARHNGAVEALYTTNDGRVLEGTTTNVFIVRNGTLITPEAGILAGVTRGVVLRLAQGLLPVQIADLPLPELYAANEVFITASNKEVLPVVQVDGMVIADGRPGPHTREIMQAYRAATEACAAAVG